MPDILMRLGRDVLVVDGAFGTMLQGYEMPPEQCPEQLNITAPEIIREIHHNYVLAGADCITSNSFGGTRAKLDEYGLGDQVEELNRAAVRLARESGVQHVLADVGPTGLVLEPLGAASYDYVFELFAEQISALAQENPDAIIIETMTDIAEARCALLAARSVCDLPVFVTCTFGLSGRMDLSGTDPATAAIILQAVGADAVGLNCGLGPEQMEPLVAEMAAATSLPLIVQPNAGLPTLVDGQTVFPGTPDEMGEHAARFVDLGAALVGSCCGSRPSFTGAIVDFVRDKPPAPRRPLPPGTVLAGPRGAIRIGGGAPIAVVGERINPTGKRALADSLREGSMSVVRQYAAEQAAAGADLLDVNVGAAGVDQVSRLREAVSAVVASVDTPVVIDTTDPGALEAALKAYPGRALINSVNGGTDSLETVLPLADTYGAAVVVLALDDEGIPADVEGRIAVVERVRDAAHKAGLHDEDLVVDTLVMTAATDASAPIVTVDALSAVKGLGLSTLLGVSNVSHGLPHRPALNAAFLTLAAAKGLDAAIVDPGDRVVTEALRIANLGRAGQEGTAHLDVQAARQGWEDAYSAAMDIASAGTGAPGGGDVAGGSSSVAGLDSDAEGSALSPGPVKKLSSAIDRGDADGAPALVDAVIAEGTAPGDVIATVLTPAIQRLGDAFGRGEVFLPQLIVAADAMRAAVERVKSHLPEGETATEGRVVFATVKGDIHSIGKDICISLLESQGFEVVDLGVDVDPESIAQQGAAPDVSAVCLSALMTTTLPAMQRSVTLLAEENPGLPVLVGGAVVTQEWASQIGAGYAADAPGCVTAVREAVRQFAEGGGQA